MPLSSKPLDIILWGATGFTGKLVATYFAQQKELNVAWAIAGRSREKLEQVKRDLIGINANLENLDLLIADSDNLESLLRLTEKARVLCTTVGPYGRYGKKLVAACVKNQAHYCDLTGEVPFIREMIDRYHEEAQQQNVKIVHCCGFDSIPSDLGTLYLQTKMLEATQKPADTLKFYVDKMKGKISGGSIASMIEILSSAQDPVTRKLLANPYALNPKGHSQGPDQNERLTSAWDEKRNVWTGPFLMAGINTRIVRRSNALLNWQYGQEFSYQEFINCGKGLKGKLTAQGNAFGLLTFAGLLSASPTRTLLKTVLPKPGEGPNEKERDAGFFEISLFGKNSEKELKCTVRGNKDPGYGATAIMLAESALCLALDGEKLPSSAGVLTPASALGMPLVGRLHRKGLTFSVS